MLRIMIAMAALSFTDTPAEPSEPLSIEHPLPRVPTLWQASRPYVIAKGLDLASTEYVLARRKDYAESNPGILADHTAMRWISGAAAAATLGWADRELQRTGHRRWARGIRWAFCGAWIVAAAINTRTAARAQR